MWRRKCVCAKRESRVCPCLCVVSVMICALGIGVDNSNFQGPRAHAHAHGHTHPSIPNSHLDSPCLRCCHTATTHRAPPLPLKAREDWISACSQRQHRLPQAARGASNVHTPTPRQNELLRRPPALRRHRHRQYTDTEQRTRTQNKRHRIADTTETEVRHGHGRKHR